MQLICLSVSHHHAPVELRECLSLPVEVINSAFAETPIRAGLFEPITELVILSTCNRLEIYGVVFSAAEADDVEASFQPLLTYLHEVFEIPTTRVEPYFRRFVGVEAVQHLYRVAAGLDSIAVGETQILGQVSRSLDTALQLGTARHVLSSLFRAAIHTGKRVRTETEVGRRPTSISTIAVQLVEQSTGALDGRRFLVVGAGKMGSTTLAALRDYGAKNVTLTSRTQDHAVEAAGPYHADVLPYERLTEGLQEADVVFTSATAPLPILRRETLAGVMAARNGRPLALIDLAVPRNVEAKARDLPGVLLYDMDDLQSFARTAEVSSHQEIARAEAIVMEEVAAYEKLLRIIPFIGELHKKVEDIRQREVERTLRHLRNPDPQVVEQLELFSRALVRKILHEPTMHLRSETDQETLNDYVDTLARLFDLSESEQTLSLQKDEKWER